MTNPAYHDNVEETVMLIIEDDSVYEIDEECIRKRGVPKECNVYEKLQKERKNKKKPQKDH